MPDLIALLTRLHVALTTRDRRTDRGDVPGWVLITVMTVGLVAVITVVARDELTSILRSALRSVD